MDRCYYLVPNTNWMEEICLFTEKPSKSILCVSPNVAISDHTNGLTRFLNKTAEMPINGGQYHQTIASLRISHLVDNLPLTPVMLAHDDSAQLTNPRKITAQIGIISLFFSQALEISVDLRLQLLIFRTELHFKLPH